MTSKRRRAPVWARWPYDRGGWPDRALSGAVAIFDDAAELLLEYDRSPFARG